MQSIGHDFPGTANDVSWGYGYNAANQLKELSRDNDAFAWNGHYNVDRSYVSNGLNQLIGSNQGISGAEYGALNML